MSVTSRWNKHHLHETSSKLLWHVLMAAWTSPFTFVTYISIFPLSSLGWYFRAVWNTASWAIVKWTKQRMSQSSVSAATPRVSWWALRELRKETKNTGPDSWGAYQRRESLPLETGWIPLTWCIQFSVNLLFPLPSLCCKNSYILAPPSSPQSSFSGLPEMLSPRPKS